MRYLINPVKALLSLFAFILFLFLFVVSFQSHKIIPMVLYAILSVVYFSSFMSFYEISWKSTKMVCEIVFYGNPTMNFPG